MSAQCPISGGYHESGHVPIRLQPLAASRRRPGVVHGIQFNERKNGRKPDRPTASSAEATLIQHRRFDTPIRQADSAGLTRRRPESILSVLTESARYADTPGHSAGFATAPGAHDSCASGATARLCHHDAHSTPLRCLARRRGLAVSVPPPNGGGRLDKSTPDYDRT